LKTANTQLNGFPKTAGLLRKNLQEIVNPGDLSGTLANGYEQLSENLYD
jgi:hypothetical protein